LYFRRADRLGGARHGRGKFRRRYRRRDDEKRDRPTTTAQRRRERERRPEDSERRTAVSGEPVHGGGERDERAETPVRVPRQSG